MKVSKFCLLLVFIGNFFISCSAQTLSKNDIFAFGNGALGVVVGNKVQIYGNSGENTWTVYSGMDMNLPNGYKDVFAFGNGALGVVVGNKVQIYGNSGENIWTVYSGMDFIK